MRTTRNPCLALAASAALGTPALADWTVIDQERFVHAYAFWQWDWQVPGVEQQQTIVAPDAGPFLEAAAVQYGGPPAPHTNARGHGSQDSTLASSVITASGRAEAEVSRGSGGSLARSIGESSFEVSFVVATPTLVRLDGAVRADLLSGWGESVASMTLSRVGGPPLVDVTAQYPGMPLVHFNQTLALAPGEYLLTARAWARSYTGSGWDWLVFADYDLSLSVDTCYPDCDGDGLLTLADFGCFQTKFALGDPYADCNGDTALNLADFGCFQTKFALGCP